MKKNRINQHLTHQVDEFLQSISDTELAARMRGSLIITGGAINNLLLDEKIRDYDVYFQDKQVVIDLCQYYIRKWTGQMEVAVIQLGEVTRDDAPEYVANRIWKEDERMHLVEYTYQGEERLGIYAGHYGGQDVEQEEKFNPWKDGAVSFKDSLGMNWLEEQDTFKKATFDDKERFRPKYFSCNAISLSDKFQLIIRFWGTPDEIHENFDFEHVKNYWTYYGGVQLLPKALECLITKELVYSGSKYPIASVIRTRKYIARGFTVSAGQYLKMMFQTNSLDLTDLYTLREQLTGIDAVYFRALLRELQNPQVMAEIKADSWSMIELIDRVLEKDYRIDDEALHEDQD